MKVTKIIAGIASYFSFFLIAGILTFCLIGLIGGLTDPETESFYLGVGLLIFLSPLLLLVPIFSVSTWYLFAAEEKPKYEY